MYVTSVIGILFSVYTALLLTLIGLFASSITNIKRNNKGFKISITAWIVFLCVIAVAFHLVTYLKLPWVKWEILGEKLIPKRIVNIDIADYKFHLPEKPLKLKVNEPVKFVLTSQDVTYGFGIFRTDGTMVFQIQVLPGHNNEITWIFHTKGRYTIRSTEYSGPENWKMVLKDSIVIE